MLACIFQIMQVTITIKTRPSKPVNTIFSIEALLRKNVKTDIVLKMHIRKISIMYNEWYHFCFQNRVCNTNLIIKLKVDATTGGIRSPMIIAAIFFICLTSSPVGRGHREVTIPIIKTLRLSSENVSSPYDDRLDKMDQAREGVR